MPTYWPADPAKIPDLLDFVVFNGISRHSLDILNDDSLSSDHTPVLVNFNVTIKLAPKNANLINESTNLDYFCEFIERNLNLNIEIETQENLDDAVESFNLLIHEAANLSTPSSLNTQILGRKVQVSATARDMIRQSRRLRRVWKRTRNPRDKTNWNQAIKLCSEILAKERNESFNFYLSKLKPHNKNKEHELYKATKYLKRPAKRNVPIKDFNDTWIKTDKAKSIAFADHLEKTFKPQCINNNTDNIMHFLDIACQMELPIKHITPQETKTEISLLNNKKSTGYDRIDAITIKSLPLKGITYLTLIFNSILRLLHFPSQWKCAEIIMILKPKKPENVISSYRPISLLPIFSNTLPS